MNKRRLEKLEAKQRAAYGAYIRSLSTAEFEALVATYPADPEYAAYLATLTVAQLEAIVDGGPKYPVPPRALSEAKREA